MKENNAKSAVETGAPTLVDVARAAGVSTATVSRCLNTPKQVSQATRDRVLDTVRALGYAPNFNAKALATRRTHTFGAVIPTMENAIFARGLQAFQDELALHGVTLLVASSSYDKNLEEQQIRALVARGADALLLIGCDRTEAANDFLAQQDVPYVVAWTNGEAPTEGVIGFDNRKAMERLTEHVLDLGHKNLAMISAPRASNDRARERAEGAQDALEKSGLGRDALEIIETPYSIENGATAFAELMKTPARPTVILCGNDVLGAGALKQAREMGLDVPNDISITGFDDIDIAEIIHPGLTTVHVPHRQMGKAAAEMLVGITEKQQTAHRLELDIMIKSRGSLAAPKSQ